MGLQRRVWALQGLTVRHGALAGAHPSWGAPGAAGCLPRLCCRLAETRMQRHLHRSRTSLSHALQRSPDL